MKITTPGSPPASTNAQEAAARDTSIGSVVTLANTPASSIGPIVVPACQATSGMPAALACSMPCACSRRSKPLMMIPSGFSASAWPKAAVRPETLPAPSMTRTSQPMLSAASSTPLVAPRMPPFFMSPATTTMVLPGSAAGPVVGPSHSVTREAYLSTTACASAMASACAGAGRAPSVSVTARAADAMTPTVTSGARDAGAPRSFEKVVISGFSFVV